MTRSGSARRRLVWASGIAGPAAFVGAWVVGGLVQDGYSPGGDALGSPGVRAA